jgi:hypothetical protein
VEVSQKDCQKKTEGKKKNRGTNNERKNVGQKLRDQYN